MALLACDVSEWQRAVSNSYPHRWLIFRACDGSYTDKRAPANLKWALAARTPRRRVRTALRKTTLIDGFTVYVVYRPGQNATILATLDRLGVPRDCVVMIDVESWSGAIRGNHSTEINALADKLAARQGSRDRVWGYANRGDYASIWPTRPAWLGLIVASYGGSKPASPGPGPMVGWQYTNGQWDVPGLPNSSKPFGHCDHNQLYIETAPIKEDDVSAQDVLDALASDKGKALLRSAIMDAPLSREPNDPKYAVSSWWTGAGVSAGNAAASAKAAAASAAAATALITELGKRVAASQAAIDALAKQNAALQQQLTDLASGKVNVSGTIPATLTIGA